MIKLPLYYHAGITRRDHATDAEDMAKRPVAFDLLGDLTGATELERALIDRIAWTMPAGTNNLRLTYSGRLSELTGAVAELIEHSFASDKAVTVLDLAASNAITSVDLFEVVRHLENVEIRASDLHAEIRTGRLGAVRLVFDDTDRWVQIVLGRLVINRPLGAKWRNWPKLAASRRLDRLFARWSHRLRHVRTIPLFHPRAVALAAAEPRFTLTQGDLLDVAPDSAEVVRVLNVLFCWTEDQQRQALKRVGAAVRDGGYLVVGDGAVPHFPLKYSIFRREGPAFRWVRDIGAPAGETEDVLALRLAGGDRKTAPG